MWLPILPSPINAIFIVNLSCLLAGCTDAANAELAAQKINTRKPVCEIWNFDSTGDMDAATGLRFALASRLVLQPCLSHSLVLTCAFLYNLRFPPHWRQVHVLDEKRNHRSPALLH